MSSLRNLAPARQLVAQDAQLVRLEGVVHVGRQRRQILERADRLAALGLTRPALARRRRRIRCGRSPPRRRPRPHCCAAACEPRRSCPSDLVRGVVAVGVVIPGNRLARLFLAWLFFAAAPLRLPALVSHRGNRPAALHGPLEPHFGVVPIQRGLKMAPVQAGVVVSRGGESLARAAQPADVLRRDVADAPAPGLVGILRRRCAPRPRARRASRR